MAEPSRLQSRRPRLSFQPELAAAEDRVAHSFPPRVQAGKITCVGATASGWVPPFYFGPERAASPRGGREEPELEEAGELRDSRSLEGRGQRADSDGIQLEWSTS